MNRKYQPSNGTEGMIFCERFCDQCLNQHPDPNHERQCMILCRTMVYDTNDKEYPEEWIYDDSGKPTCTAFIKWDWDRDDDGNWIEPIPVPPDDPNQLVMPFIFEEMGIGEPEVIKL